LAAPTPVAPATARVLICDPDIRFGLLLKEFLEGQGWSADWVADGRKALAQWEALLPDLVVTELQGEDLDGFEFLDAMTRIAHPPPVVVCTRLKGVQGWDQGVLRSLGVRRVLARPVRFPAVAQMLEEVMTELTATMEAIPALAEVAFNQNA
jgi:CheY-like chemotaxis protein